MPYTTKQLKIGNTDQLDYLAHEAGAVWSDTVVKFWRVVRHSDHWLSKNAMQKLIRNNNLHSQTVQGITDSFYESLKSWKILHKTDHRANPPRKRHWYHAIPFKESAIKLKDGNLILSTGRGNQPIVIPWLFGKPKVCEISYSGKEYVLNATYAIEPTENNADGFAGVDLGEVHIAVVCTGERIVIANGRELRSKRRYQNKAKGSFQKKLSKKKKGSRRYKKVNNAKHRVTNKLNNQIRDILHKQTTKLVCILKEDGIQTVGIGDLRDIRDDCNDPNSKNNQKLHQMLSGKARHYITYKAERLGMTVELVDEAYTSQTCPQCTELNKTKDRNYICEHCGYTGHRDGVGSYNIRHKTKYQGEMLPVVGDMESKRVLMTPPVGIKYQADTQNASAANTSPCKSAAIQPGLSAIKAVTAA